MPRLSVWMVRSALLHLAGGIFLGGLILWQKGPGGLPTAWRWLPLHIHGLLVGWTVQVIFGVAYWILPRFATRNAAGRVEQARGREGLAWASFGLLHGSTLAMALAAWPGGPGWAAASGLLAAGAGLAFVLHAWPRVKPFMADG